MNMTSKGAAVFQRSQSDAVEAVNWNSMMAPVLYRVDASKPSLKLKARQNQTRLYRICKTSLVGAVVAQPGRALDLFKRGEAEDRAVVSSNLTDGTLN
jgi:hypothetical protein